MAFDGQIGQERLNLGCPHAGRMLHGVKTHKGLHPMKVGLLGPDASVFDEYGPAPDSTSGRQTNHVLSCFNLEVLISNKAVIYMGCISIAILISSLLTIYKPSFRIDT